MYSPGSGGLSGVLPPPGLGYATTYLGNGLGQAYLAAGRHPAPVPHAQAGLSGRGPPTWCTLGLHATGLGGLLAKCRLPGIFHGQNDPKKSGRKSKPQGGWLDKNQS